MNIVRQPPGCLFIALLRIRHGGIMPDGLIIVSICIIKEEYIWITVM